MILRGPAPTPGLDLFVDALAAYRVTRFVTQDTLIDTPRDWVTERAPEKVAELIDCPHCVGVWIAAGVTVCRLVDPVRWERVARWLAIAGGVSLVADHLAAAREV